MGGGGETSYGRESPKRAMYKSRKERFKETIMSENVKSEKLTKPEYNETTIVQIVLA